MLHVLNCTQLLRVATLPMNWIFMSNPNSDAEPVIIKKYANRRLYDTGSSSYITLEHLSEMTRAGRDFKVVDAKTGADITHGILTQIIVEEESRGGSTLLPVNFLRQLISMYGGQMQAMVPHYLEASMEAFRRNQEQTGSAMLGLMTGGGNNPFQALARQNMAMLKAAADMFGQQGIPGMATPQESPQNKQAAASDDVNELKAQLKALQARIDELSGK